MSDNLARRWQRAWLVVGTAGSMPLKRWRQTHRSHWQHVRRSSLIAPGDGATLQEPAASGGLPLDRSCRETGDDAVLEDVSVKAIDLESKEPPNDAIPHG
jgi:hypothetical protein